MTPADVLRSSGRVLGEIDSALRPPIDLDILCHPGQIHVPIVDERWYQDWVDGAVDENGEPLVTDCDAQRYADDTIDLLVGALSATGWVECWFCGRWGNLDGGDMHPGCRDKWSTVVDRRRPPAVRRERYGRHFDSDADPVDGVGVRVSRHARYFAATKPG